MKKYKPKVGAFRSRIWWEIIDPEIGLCYSGHPGRDCVVVRAIMMHRPGTNRYMGRRSYDKQPRRFMKIGWYADYMREEWGVTQKRGPDWLYRLRRRREISNES